MTGPGTLDRVSAGRSGDEPRCISCRHWDSEDPGDNMLSRETAITLRYGDYAGLGGRCLKRDCGAMSKAWCGLWEEVVVPTLLASEPKQMDFNDA